LKKRTKKLCEFGFGLSWRTAAEIIKRFLLLFSKKDVLCRLPCALAPPSPRAGVGDTGQLPFFQKRSPSFGHAQAP
jgi:hypothetical protein